MHFVRSNNYSRAKKDVASNFIITFHGENLKELKDKDGIEFRAKVRVELQVSVWLVIYE